MTLTTHRDGDMSALVLHGTAEQAGAHSLLAAGAPSRGYERLLRDFSPWEGQTGEVSCGQGSPISATWVAVSCSVSDCRPA